jgi:hypothetical protein
MIYTTLEADFYSTCTPGLFAPPSLLPPSIVLLCLLFYISLPFPHSGFISQFGLSTGATLWSRRQSAAAVCKFLQRSRSWTVDRAEAPDRSMDAMVITSFPGSSSSYTPLASIVRKYQTLHFAVYLLLDPLLLELTSFRISRSRRAVLLHTDAIQSHCLLGYPQILSQALYLNQTA